jgi:N-acetylmuramoyl-L-alanine amidase
MSIWSRVTGIFKAPPGATVAEGPRPQEAWPHPWPRLTEKDRDILTRTLFGEAGNETDAGQVAVIHSIRNRLLRGPAKRFGGTPAQVCLQPWQFSCWNESDPMRARMLAMKPESATYQRLAETVDRAWVMPDTIGGADHYYASYIAKPRWAEPPARMTVRHGVHMFFAGVR